MNELLTYRQLKRRDPYIKPHLDFALVGERWAVYDLRRGLVRMSPAMYELFNEDMDKRQDQIIVEVPVPSSGKAER